MKNKYTFISAQWCANCNPMKLWLTQQGVDFVTIDIDEAEDGYLDSLNVRAIPTLVLNEEVVAIGEDIRSYIKEKLNNE